MPSASLNDTKLGGVAGRCCHPERPHQMKKWDDRNLMKFDKKKCIPPPGEEQSKAPVFVGGC